MMAPKLLSYTALSAVLLAFQANAADINITSQTELNDTVTALTAADSALLKLTNNILADSVFAQAVSGATVTIDGGVDKFKIEAASDGVNHPGLTVATGTTYNFQNLEMNGFYSTSGGTITNNGTIGQVLNVSFNNNTSEEAGAAIYNVGTIGSISGDFTNNTAQSASWMTGGGAIYSSGPIESINGNFTGNQANSATAEASGGAIYIESALPAGSTMNALNGTFTNNHTQGETSAEGGAIYQLKGTITSLQGTFDGNYVIGNTGNAYGGAISNYGTINEIINSVFTNNYAQTNAAGSNAWGGAIVSDSNLKLVANNGLTKFSGNYVIDGNGVRTNEGIHLLGNATKMELNATNNGKIEIDDNISAVNPFEMAISGDDTSEVKLNGQINNLSKLTLTGTTLSLGTGSDGSFANTDFVSSRGTLNLINDTMQTLAVKSLDTTSDVKLQFDANLATGESDKISAGSVVTGSKISLGSMNILADGTSDIELFTGGIAPEFANLDSFAAFTSDFKYTFASDTPGILKVASQNSAAPGLNGAVLDTTATRSYSVGDGVNVSANLGAIGGGNDVSLTILGNNKVLDGAGFSGLEAADTQKLIVENVLDVKNFASVAGGFAKNDGTMEVKNSTFTGNSAQTDGGALQNTANGKLKIENASFTGNKAEGIGDVHGGAISNAGALAQIFNTSFTNNFAKTTTAGNAALGGAIYSASNISINAAGGNSVFSGNYTEDANGVKTANDIYMANAASSLSLSSSGGGLIQFDSGIDGVAGYKIEINGDDASTVKLNAAAKNVGDVTLNNTNLVLAQENFLDGANFNLESGKLDLSNGTFGVATFNNFNGTNGILSLDVDPVAGVADKLVINGDLTGTTKLLVNANGVTKPENDILFAETHNDNDATAGAFEIWRVAGNPYQWQTRYDSALKEWFMNTVGDPIIDSPTVTPETIAYMGLNSTGFQQTRSMLSNVYNKVASSRALNSYCGSEDRECFNPQPQFNMWANPVYSSAKVDSPVKYDANLTGMEAGGDIQIGSEVRLGLFGSYRQGKYDFDGKADRFRSLVASNIDIDSYIGGLYLRHEYRNAWTMAAVYGGVEQAKIKTDDGIRAESDGVTFGGSLETGLAYEIADTVVMEPSIGASYAQVSFDDVKDEAGKTAAFGDAKQIELSAGVKFEKLFDLYYGYGKLYFKPSLIQTFVSGDEIRITGLDSVSTLENETLGRLAVGGSLYLLQDLNAFASAEYTFNDSYEDMAVSLGLSYSF